MELFWDVPFRIISESFQEIKVWEVEELISMADMNLSFLKANQAESFGIPWSKNMLD